MGLTLQDTFNNTEPTVVGEHIRASVDPEVTSPISNPTQISTQVHTPTTLFQHPIELDIVGGWNIIGYPHPYEGDVRKQLYALFFNTTNFPSSDNQIDSELTEAGLQIVKNNEADVYWPQYNFNGIGNLKPGQGYQLRTFNPFPGRRWKIFNPSNPNGTTPLTNEQFLSTYGTIQKYTNELNSQQFELLQGWNIISYNRFPNPNPDADSDPDVVNQISIDNGVDIDNITIVKNNAAKVYWPEWNFNGIGDLIPGQGYQIRTVDASTVNLFSPVIAPSDLGIPLYLTHPDATTEDQSSIDNFS